MISTQSHHSIRCRCLWLGIAWIVLAPTFGTTSAETPMSSAEFSQWIAETLPVEDRYQYHRTFLTGSMHEAARDRSLTPQPDEISLASGDWQILSRERMSDVIDYACSDTIEFFDRAMESKVTWKKVENLASHDGVKHRILVGLPSDFATGFARQERIGNQLVRSKDYQLLIDRDQIVVCGWDAAGIMHGLFDLQSRCLLREAPYLPRELSTVRLSRYQTRMILSWLGWMEWPDRYLNHLAHDGYDAIFASVYANPNGVPGPPHYDLIRTQDPEKLRDVLARAKKFGIRVYAPILWANTGEAENQQQLRAHVRDIVTKFPDIAGYILLTEGFFYQRFIAGSRHGDEEMHDWAKHWTEAVAIVDEECKKLNPAIEVLPWEYNIDFRPQRADLKRHVVSLLPATSIPLLTWENGTAFSLDQLQGYLRDYSISQVGPAEVSKAQIAEARRRSMKVYCKADAFATWQFGTTPYLPCPQQWQRRYDAMADYQIDGTLESWSNGYKPNFVASLRRWGCWTEPMEYDTLLQQTAAQLFGKEGAPHAIAAWEHFSEAIRLVPDTGPSMGTNNAVGNPLFFDEPPPRIMTLNHSWWDEAKKTPWRHRMVDAWPFAHRMMVFEADFSNRKNAAEAYARQRSGVGYLDPTAPLPESGVLPIFNKYLLAAADRFELGLQQYRLAAKRAPPAKQYRALREVNLVEQMQRMLRSLHTLLTFEDLRLRLMKSENVTEQRSWIAELNRLVEDEIVRTEASLIACERDSRLGYQMEMDYVHTPFVLRQKLEVLRETRDEQLPRFLKRVTGTNDDADSKPGSRRP